MSRLPLLVIHPLHAPFPRAALPWSLVALRLGLCPLLPAMALAGANRSFLFFLLALGVMSDIFDGILARRLGVATPLLRRADSLVDLFFWLSVLGAAQDLNGFISRNLLPLALLLASEALCDMVSLRRFGQPPATHSYAAKAWGLLLFAGFGLDFLGEGSEAIDLAMLIFGMVVNFEVIAIMLLSKTQPVDVPSVWMLLGKRRQPGNGRVMFGDRV